MTRLDRALADVALLFIAGLAASGWLTNHKNLTPATSEGVAVEATVPEEVTLQRHGAVERAGRSENTVRTSLPVTPRPIAVSLPSLPTWLALADCETAPRDNGIPRKGAAVWTAHTGNGFEGGLQLAPDAESRDRVWRETPAQQIARAEALWSRRQAQTGNGFDAWPDCARRLGLR